MINIPNFTRNIVNTALTRIGYYTLDAEILILTTGLAESGLIHRKQIGGGPALGLFQMEVATHNDIWENFLKYRIALIYKLESLLHRDDKIYELQYNDLYAAAMCRIHYLRVKDPIPSHDDKYALGEYWKKYYNTEKGAGSVEKFIDRTKIIWS